MATRSVSLVNKIELDFQGNIYRNAIAFGDVDGDGKNELIISNTAGQLFIFKGRHQKAWKLSQGLGCVTVVVVGKIKNDGADVILCLNTEGNCFLFNQIQGEDTLGNENLHEKPGHLKSSKSISGDHHGEKISSSYKQTLDANPKMAMIADVDGDGCNELVVCYTDRYVRVFKWNCIQKPEESKPQKDDDVIRGISVKRNESKLTKQPSKDEEGRVSSVPATTLVKQPSKDSSTAGNSSPPQKASVVENVSRKDSNAKPDFIVRQEEEGKFVMVQEFHLSEQIGSVALTKQLDGKTHLIASQPAGGYAVLAVYDGYCEKPKDRSTSHTEHTNAVSDKDSKQLEHPLICQPVASFRLRNLKVDSEVLGGIRRDHVLTGLFCICTVDGSYLLVDNNNQGVTALVSSTVTQHRWFTMNSLDLNMDGNDVIVLCSSDGMTYVIDQDLETIGYNFGDAICGFRAGLFAVDTEINVPCFCYVTFSNRLVLYYDVKSIFCKSKSLQAVLLEKLKTEEDYQEILTEIQNEDGDIDESHLKKLIGQVLHESFSL